MNVCLFSKIDKSQNLDKLGQDDGNM